MSFDNVSRFFAPKNKTPLQGQPQPKIREEHFMPKTTKTYEEQIAERDAKILQYQNEKKRIMQKQKSADRKARDNRLYKRHGLLEKFMPDLIDITDVQYELFIKTGINTTYGRKRLGEIISEGAEKIADEVSETAGSSGTNGGTTTSLAESSEA